MSARGGKALDMRDNFLAWLFHENTCLTSATVRRFAEEIQPPPIPERPHACLACPAVPLRGRRFWMPLGRVLRLRRSCREFAAEPVPLRRLARVALAAVGSGAPRADGTRQRSYPSAGALYPISCYLLARNVKGLAAGVYHLNGDRRVLEVVARREDRRAEYEADLRRAIPGDSWLHAAAFYILLAGDIERATAKYGARGYRFLLLEAGHVAQNFELAATAAGMAHLTLGGFCEGELERLAGLTGTSFNAVYLIAFG